MVVETHKQTKVKVSTRVLPNGEKYHLEINREANLRELLQEGTLAANETLIHDENGRLLDRLHNLHREHHHQHIDPSITDLEQLVGEYIDLPHTTHHFGIELVRAITINSMWREATNEHMTPREILALFGLTTEFTLFATGSDIPIPLDIPISLHRGQKLEAHKDGSYGARVGG